jgi:hypothetical protein
MPRVNRDLQRRLAARRERERRRPTERRYNFATTEPELVDGVGSETDADADTDVVEVDGEADTNANANAEVATGVPAARGAASARTSRATSATTASSPARGNARSTYRPFSDYKEEYAYVYSDLKRVAVVVGGLLIALLVLYFALPLLAH